MTNHARFAAILAAIPFFLTDTSNRDTVSSLSTKKTIITVKYRGLNVLLVITLYLTACGGGGDGAPKNQSRSTQPASVNSAPIAIAGDDQNTLDSAQITLSGSGSDSDGTIATFLWQQVAGSTVTLSSSSSAATTFTAPESAGTLTFELTVTDDAGATHTDSVDINVSYAYEAPPTVTSTTYTQTDPATFITADTCTSFEANYHPNTMSATYYEIDADSIAMIWGADYTNLSTSDATILTELQTDPTKRQNVVDSLNEMRRILSEDYKVNASHTIAADDGLCYRTNVYLKGTAATPGDTDPGGGGGAVCAGDSIKRLPWISLPPGYVTFLANGTTNQAWMLAHEYMHTVQCGVDRGTQTGWEWYTESFANYFGNEVQDWTVALDQFHQNTAWSIDAYFTRYGTWPFWMFLSHRLGHNYTADVLQRVSQPDETLLEYLRRIAPFLCAPSDTQCRNDGFSNLYAEFANSTVNYALYSQQEGVDYRSIAINPNTGLPRASATMHKVAPNRYRIADWLAPQRFGHNIIQLVPDPNNRTLTIRLDGWEIATRETSWRATVVATLDDAAVPPVEAYGEMFSSGTQVIDLEQWETDLGATIQKLHLVVAAVPQNWKHESELSSFSSPDRFNELDAYVYEVAITGGWPLGHEPESERTAPAVLGAAHNNGGGFVANSATVNSSAYVGPEARVLDSAQVLGNARIEGRAIISGNAVIQDNAIVSSSVEMMHNTRAEGFATVRDNVLMRDNASVIDSGKLQGDTSVYNSYLVSGQAVSFGTPLIETTGNVTLTGTAISNGHGWVSSGSVNQGTSYDDWTVNDNGLFLHYDFSEPHPYRIKDIHASSDAYYLGTNGRIGGSPSMPTDFTLSSNVLTLDGSGYLEMPRWLLDQRSYQFEMFFYWAGSETTEYLLDTNTARDEQLALQVVPTETNKFDLRLSFTDRNNATREVLLQHAMMESNVWLNVAINYDDTTSTIKLMANPLSGTPLVESSATLPTSTREFDYDTLTIRLGADMAGSSPFIGRVDDVKLTR